MPTANDIVAAARGWTGTPYRHQASSKGVGCDCLGLVRGVWRDVYGSEPETPPPYAPGWAESSGEEALAAAGFRHLLPVPDLGFVVGDVLLFRWKPHLPAKHAAIAVPAGRMIHAHDGLSVCEVSLSPWWRKRLAFVFRFPDLD
jgi:NlpC/P60 family putative phage cell wall peptidase